MRSPNLGTSLVALLVCGLYLSIGSRSDAFPVIAVKRIVAPYTVGPFYVSLAGDDNNDGLAPGPTRAVKHISAALSRYAAAGGAGGGGTIYLVDGPFVYTGDPNSTPPAEANLVINVGGMGGQNLVIESYNPGSLVTISGPPSPNESDLDLIRINAPGVTLRNLRIVNGPIKGIYVASDNSLDPMGGTVIDSCDISYCGYAQENVRGGEAILIGDKAHNTVVKRCVIHQIKEHAIYVSGVATHQTNGIQIRNNLIYGCAMDMTGGFNNNNHAIQFNPNGGITGSAGFWNCVIDGNEVHDCYGNATNIGNFNNGQISNNLFYNNAEAELFIKGSSGNQIRFNTLITTQKNTGRACMMFSRYTNPITMCTNNIFKSNICCDLTGNYAAACIAFDDGCQPTDSDYNFFYRTLGTNSPMFRNETTNQSWSTRAAWNAAFNIDFWSRDGWPGADPMAGHYPAIGFVSQMPVQDYQDGMPLKYWAVAHPPGVDFSLAAGSYAIDVGTGYSPIGVDILGNPRIAWYGADMGCYERQQNP
jgi:hypothetical protein